MRQKLLFTTLLLIALLTASLPWLSRRLTELTAAPSYYSQPDFSKAAEKLPATGRAEMQQAAWIPDWGYRAGFSGLQKNVNHFQSVSPVWYYLEKDGRIRVNRVGLTELTQYCRQHGIKLIPSIFSSDPAELSLVLSDPAKLKRHIDFIKNEVIENGYDGFDLDYESIYLFDQNNFFTLVTELSSFMRERDKLLTMAVLSKWADEHAYSGLTQTRKVQNLAMLAPYIDEFRLMAYGYTGPSNGVAGPIGPLDWQEAIIRYALRYLPPSKIMLGVNLYGYAWEDSGSLPVYNSYLEGSGDSGSQSFVLTAAQAQERISNYGARIEPDDSSGELILTYQKDGKAWRAYTPSIATNQKRLALAKNYGIKGIVYWRLGDEAETMFRVMDDRL